LILEAMTQKPFEAALGIGASWRMAGTDFDAWGHTLSILVDFAKAVASLFQASQATPAASSLAGRRSHRDLPGRRQARVRAINLPLQIQQRLFISLVGIKTWGAASS